MSEILVERAIDRSKYPKAMIYVDKQGNICKADRPKPLSEEEKAKRQIARNEAKAESQAEGEGLREALSKARKQAKKEPSVVNAEVLELAQQAYAEFKAGK